MHIKSFTGLLFMFSHNLLAVNIALILILIILYFFTPQIFTDSVFGMLHGTMEFIYKVKDNKRLIRYAFDHAQFDGALMVHTIQQELVDYKTIDDVVVYNFKPYQNLDSTRIPTFSRFTSSISYLLREMVARQKKTIRICIIVSIRNNLKDFTSKGNFIKYACFTVAPSDRVIDICSKLQTSVKNVQSSYHFRGNPTLHDFTSVLSADYVFDSWRIFSSIHTKSGNLLVRQPTTSVSEEDIYNLKHSRVRSFITLDFLDDKYIISAIFTL